jgi:thymidine kinase
MSISLFLGPMYSGKSSSVINELERHNLADIKTLMIKYKFDTRYSMINEIITHNRRKYSEDQGLIQVTDDLSTLDTYILNNEIKVVGIDEFQFYKHPEYVIRWANDYKIKIYLAALDGDFQTQIFENVSFILPKCDYIKKLSAVCEKCKSKKGIVTRRTTNESARVIIGGKESYTALCRKCATWDGSFSI